MSNKIESVSVNLNRILGYKDCENMRKGFRKFPKDRSYIRIDLGKYYALLRKAPNIRGKVDIELWTSARDKFQGCGSFAYDDAGGQKNFIMSKAKVLYIK